MQNHFTTTPLQRLFKLLCGDYTQGLTQTRNYTRFWLLWGTGIGLKIAIYQGPFQDYCPVTLDPHQSKAQNTDFLGFSRPKHLSICPMGLQ